MRTAALAADSPVTPPGGSAKPPQFAPEPQNYIGSLTEIVHRHKIRGGCRGLTSLVAGFSTVLY
jgi:hypothetical protein